MKKIFIPSSHGHPKSVDQKLPDGFSAVCDFALTQRGYQVQLSLTKVIGIRAQLKGLGIKFTAKY